MPGFTHLHSVSGFSLRYGASHPERLAERASERGMDALALTDRDTLAGTVRFAKACAKAGVRPLFGVGLAVEEAEPVRQERRRAPVRGGAFVDESAPVSPFSPGTVPAAGPTCAGSSRWRTRTRVSGARRCCPGPRTGGTG